MPKFKSFVLAALLAGFASQAADAHAVWFAQRARQTALIYGIGADDLDAVKRFSFIEKITGYDADYQPFAASARIAGPIVLVDADQQPTLLSVVFFNGVWSRVDGEFVTGGRDKNPKATLAEKNYKYSVSIMGPLSTPIPVLADQVLQIAPAGPIPDQHGAKLTYRVLFKGKPVSGAKVINDLINDPDQKPLVSGADGTVTMEVRNQGLNVIQAVYNGPSDDAKQYDRIENTATLTFTLAHAPE